jgi:hypothetical protein
MLVTTDTGEVDVDLDQQEIQDGVKAHYEAKGFVLRPKSEIEAEKEAVKTETASRVAKEVHGTWEKEVGSVLGEEKPKEIKGVDWAKSKFSELKEKADKKPEGDGGGAAGKTVADEVQAAQLAAMKKELDDFKAAQAAEKAGSEQKVINSGIRASVRALPVDGETPEQQEKLRGSLEVLVKTNYNWKRDEKSDELVPYDNEGNVVLDPATQRPKTLNKIVEDDFSFMLKKPAADKDKVGGTGTTQDDLNGKKNVDVSKGVKAASEEEIIKIAREQGLVAGSPERKAFIEASKKLSNIK